MQAAAAAMVTAAAAASDPTAVEEARVAAGGRRLAAAYVRSSRRVRRLASRHSLSNQGSDGRCQRTYCTGVHIGYRSYNLKLEINVHHLRGNAIPAGPLSDFDEIVCR